MRIGVSCTSVPFNGCVHPTSTNSAWNMGGNGITFTLEADVFMDLNTPKTISTERELRVVSGRDEIWSSCTRHV